MQKYSGLGVLFATISLLTPAPTAAQWLPVERNGNVSTIKHSNGSFLILTAIPQEPGNNAKNMAAAAPALAKSFGEQVGCSGANWSATRPLDDKTGYWLQGNTRSFTCMFGTAQANGKIAIAVGQLRNTESDFYSEYVRVLQKVMSIKLAETAKTMPGAPTAQAKPGKQAPGTPAAISPAGRTALSDAIARIPAAHRPVGMGYLYEWDSVAMSMGYTPYMLFRGNVAIEADCVWNPSLPPVESARQNDCDVTRWRGTLPGSVYVGTDSPEESGGFRGFAPGERITVNMSTQSGGSVGGQFTGTTSVLSSGELRMNTAGRIAIGSWTGTSTTGNNFGAYGSSGGAINGDYYLEGYVLAIRDASGKITIGTIARKQEGRDSYMFVNGEQYWN
jgi:hypothetical protein